MSISGERLEEMAGQILQIYDEAEQIMLRRVAKRAAKGVDEPGWTEKKYREMATVRREMASFVKRLSADRRGMQERFLQEAYEDGQSQMISDARRYADLAGIEHLTPNAIKVINIMSELDGGMNAADRQILRSVDDAYANIVGRTSALVATGTITTREAVKRELNEFADRGIKSFTDRAGRVWDMETYAEMATLTAIERASREGYMDTAREFGYDLVMISDHYGACPICEAWHGVVVSIDGKTPGYLTLADAEAAGVFHPRCMHDYSVYYEGISKEGRIGPREVKEPNAGYTARSQQRYFERRERQWKRRMAVATTPEDERAAYARVRMYQQKIRDLREAYNASTPKNVDYLPRKYWREGGKAPKLSAAAKKIKSSTLNIPASRGIVEQRKKELRNTVALSKTQSDAAVKFAVFLGMPPDRVEYRPYGDTAYIAAWDYLKICNDVYPNPSGTRANSKMSYRAALSHEIVGHRQTCLRGTAFEPYSVEDEAQASVRAALLAPNLTLEERVDLLQDAMDRLKDKGLNLEDWIEKFDLEE